MNAAPSELIAETADETKPQLAIVTRIFTGRRSRKAKGEGDRSKQRIASKVTHVSWTRMHAKQARKGRDAIECVPRRVEIKVLAEFEGATGEDAARDFIKLLQKGCTAAEDHGGHCKADGPTPPPFAAVA